MIDEVRVWNVVRSPAEIATSWNRRLAGTESGLVAYYPMQEGTGTTTADSSGHGYTAALVNHVLWNTKDDSVGPLAVTELATWHTATGAQLNAVVKPGVSNIVAWFEWGLNTNYGSSTATTNVGSSFLKELISAEVTGMLANQTYHFRAVGSNTLGISYGADRSFVVVRATTLLDSGAGSLRQAISDAVPGAIIYLTNTGTLTLTGGQLLLSRDVCIAGPGAGDLAISGNGSSRVFNVGVNVTASISGLTILNGRAANGAANAAGSSGGGVYNEGTLTLSECVVTNNRAGDGGAGSGGGSSAGGANGGNGGDGGGVWNGSGAVLTLRQCTTWGNSGGSGGRGGDGGHGYNGSASSSASDGGPGGSGGRGGLGGGVYGGGTVTLDRCTLASNSTGVGGAGGNGGGGGDGGAWRYDQDGGNGGMGEKAEQAQESMNLDK